jgi:outer membrane protein OmpA-like peptidoglycan-associated protein
MLRANAVAAQLKTRGIGDEQMAVIAYGGTRTVIAQSDHADWDRNRRVELILVQIDANQ